MTFFWHSAWDEKMEETLSSAEYFQPGEKNGWLMLHAVGRAILLGISASKFHPFNKGQASTWN